MHAPTRRAAAARRTFALLALAIAVAGPGLAAPLTATGATDRTAPVVGMPVAALLAGGTVRPASIPFRVTWTASDGGGSGVVASSLQLSVDGGSWARVALASAGARSATVRLRPPHEVRFRTRATDRAGNTSAWRYGTAFRVNRLPETSGAVTRSAGWALASSEGFLGGSALRSRTPGARLTLSFTGSQVAWFGRRSSSTGSAKVYLDGHYQATVRTVAATSLDRRILYVARWPESGDHTLTIEVVGTAGHPAIVVDGLIVVDPPATDPVLVGAGDVAVCGAPADNRTADLLDRIAGRVFLAGDAVYPDGSAAQFRDCFAPSWGRWRLRTSPAVGNHEYRTAGAGPYWDYFGSRAGTRGQGWYAYDLGAWRVYSLNTNCTKVGCGTASTQVEWLRADLAANPRACVAAVMHHPLFSSGEHGDNPVVRPLWEALDEAGADVILAGHDHDYERFAPQGPTGDADPGGIRAFVVGTGGAALRPFVTVRANSEIRDADTHGVLMLTLRAGTYDWRFVPVAGSTFADRGTGTCH